MSFVFADGQTRVELGGVDISDFIVGVLDREPDPWQRAVLAVYSTPLQMPEVRLARHHRLSAMRSAYRARRR